MRVIDAMTGHDLQVGVPLSDRHDVFDLEGRLLDGVGRRVTLLSVDEGLFRATLTADVDGRIMKLTVPVRYMHPSFLFQKVAFWPS